MTPLLTRRGSPERAFDSLYKSHVNDVYRYSLAMLAHKADAEDATQTTFLNAYRALQRGQRPRDARKWLRAITLNVCREQYRRASRRPAEVSLNDDPGELVLDPPTPELGDVLRGLSVLPFNQRAALVMREFEGRSVKEVARQLEVSVAAVETLLFRARRALREQLEGALSCSEAERAISRQLDGALPRGERGPLRAHLRECPECAALARRLRAQRGAMRSLALALPLPASLRFGGATPTAGIAGSSSVGVAVGAKLAALTVATAAVVGAGYVSLHHPSRHHAPQAGSSRAQLVASRSVVPQGRPVHRVLPAAVAPASASPSAHNVKNLGAAHKRPGRALGRGHRAPVARGKPTSTTGHGHAYAYGHTKPKHGHAYGHAKARPLGRATKKPSKPLAKPHARAYGASGSLSARHTFSGR